MGILAQEINEDLRYKKWKPEEIKELGKTAMVKLWVNGTKYPNEKDPSKKVIWL